MDHVSRLFFHLQRINNSKDFGFKEESIIFIRKYRLNEEEDDTAVLIFAKIPRENYVKTRLSGSNLSSTDILNLYEAFLQDTIEQAVKSSAAKIFLSLTDIEQINSSKLADIDFFNNKDILSFEKLSQDFHVQPDGEFGERMKSFINWAFDLNYKKLIILGADSPQIQPTLIDTSIDLLDSYDVVLGPSAEGGIYLIGIKPGMKLDGFEELFKEVELSSFAKFAKDQSLSINILQELVDVDQESDLIGLIAWLDSVEIQMTQNHSFSKNDKISIPTNTLFVVRKIGLTISVDAKNNRQKKLIKLESAD
ncbi:MAG: TIGR04282 family arsenosugar biosynthesis glycosyltransferase [Candidatus Kariarchaeaceae archaeon]|jgi:glycosyltransferase A (GT-A) superfamily protein (DUF2064 family)